MVDGGSMALAKDLLAVELFLGGVETSSYFGFLLLGWVRSTWAVDNVLSPSLASTLFSRAFTRRAIISLVRQQALPFTAGPGLEK
jgi:hypothetical protein